MNKKDSSTQASKQSTDENANELTGDCVSKTVELVYLLITRIIFYYEYVRTSTVHNFIIVFTFS